MNPEATANRSDSLGEVAGTITGFVIVVGFIGFLVFLFLYGAVTFALDHRRQHRQAAGIAKASRLGPQPPATIAADGTATPQLLHFRR